MRQRLLYACLFFTVAVFTTQAQKLPAQKDILASMTKANAYFMHDWPDPGKETVTDKVRPSNIWTRAVYYEGLMALYGIDPQKTYHEYAVDWGTKHNWGFRSGPTTRNADDQCCAQTYIDLYELDKPADPTRIRNAQTSLDAMVKTDKIDDWNWIDALQMAMPVFTKLGVLTNQQGGNGTPYFEKMYQMYQYTKTRHGGSGLYNPTDHLWWRDKEFVPPYAEPNGQDCYWSRGNGWVVAALVRVLDVLPKTEPHYAEYKQDYLDMMQALRPLQRPDGFWNVSLHDSTHFGGKETTGTSLFVYGMAWGVNHGLLDGSVYKPIIFNAWNGMATDALHPDGFLGFVQGTGKEPKDGQPVTYDSKPNFQDYGVGCFLLAGSEVYRLKR